MEDFIAALKERDLKKIRMCPKSDLHNHFVLGGSRAYLRQVTGARIEPVKHPLSSMEEMHKWNRENLGAAFDSAVGRQTLIRAAFVQAREDGITLLEIGEDVWGLGAYFHGCIDELTEAFAAAQRTFAPHTRLRLQIGLSRHCSIAYLEECLSHFWGNRAFYSIDLYGDEMAQPIENFKGIYRRAKREGLRLKAHVGEWGSASDVQRAVETLELDEVQHGIAAADDPQVVRFLADHHIRLNITPTSNVLLGRVPFMASHPIGRLYRSGVDVTVNSDDLLMFGSDVSGEYLRLYEAGCLTAEELDDIRRGGLEPR
ncbi:MAG: adenosine deaminase [Butyricicoccaceae bacterium]